MSRVRNRHFTYFTLNGEKERERERMIIHSKGYPWQKKEESECLLLLPFPSFFTPWNLLDGLFFLFITFFTILFLPKRASLSYSIFSWPGTLFKVRKRDREERERERNVVSVRAQRPTWRSFLNPHVYETHSFSLSLSFSPVKSVEMCSVHSLIHYFNYYTCPFPRLLLLLQ